MRDIKFRAWDKTLNKFSDLEGVVIRPNGEVWDGHTVAYDLIVMQYTGLTDKNGVEIYEGDLLSADHLNNAHNRPEVVEFNIEPYIADYANVYGYEFTYLASELEVIGNIYENRELLK